MEELVTSDNWFNVVNYNEEIKSLTQEIEAFNSRIYSNSTPEDDIDFDKLNTIAKRVADTWSELIAERLILLTEDSAKDYTSELNQYWHYFNATEDAQGLKEKEQ